MAEQRASERAPLTVVRAVADRLAGFLGVPVTPAETEAAGEGEALPAAITPAPSAVEIGRFGLRSEGERFVLRDHASVPESLLRRLSDGPLAVDIDAAPTGSVAFAREPLVTIEGPLAQVLVAVAVVRARVARATAIAANGCFYGRPREWISPVIVAETNRGISRKRPGKQASFDQTRAGKRSRRKAAQRGPGVWSWKTSPASMEVMVLRRAGRCLRAKSMLRSSPR